MRQLIRHLEDALALADEIQDGHTGAPRDHQALHGEVTFSELIDELVKAMRRARKSSRTSARCCAVWQTKTLGSVMKNCHNRAGPG
jgi:hypothetical protein